MEQFQLIPHYSISPNSVALYSLPDKKSGYNKKNKGWNNLKDNTNVYSELSRASQKRLKNKINYMLYLTDPKLLNTSKLINTKNPPTNKLQKSILFNKKLAYKITFITLTLPSKQVHSDKIIKANCLNQFLIELTKNHHVNNYIWKAEKQENGNIHFHVIADSYVHWSKIRKIWNRIVNKLGYVNAYQQTQKEFFKNGFQLSKNPLDKRTYNQQLKSYRINKKNNFSNPNSTDIHAIAKIRNISAYVSKYLAKGVTKTNRIKKIDALLNRIKKVDENITKLYQKLPFQKLHSVNYQLVVSKINYYKKIKDTNIKALEVLRLQGVTGRIWFCNSTLSKCKNYSEVGTEFEIPDFHIIRTIYTYAVKHKVGEQNVIVIYFDINKCPQLKKLFDKHLTLKLTA